MMSDPCPKFKPGDRVESFRGEKATVITVRKVDVSGKSHRVTVTYDSDASAHPVEFYEEVFHPLTPEWTEVAIEPCSYCGGDPLISPSCIR